MLVPGEGAAQTLYLGHRRGLGTVKSGPRGALPQPLTSPLAHLVGVARVQGDVSCRVRHSPEDLGPGPAQPQKAGGGSGDTEALGPTPRQAHILPLHQYGPWNREPVRRCPRRAGLMRTGGEHTAGGGWLPESLSWMWVSPRETEMAWRQLPAWQAPCSSTISSCPLEKSWDRC